MTIPEAHKRELYKYLYGILTRRNCSLLRMNGVSNHVHMLVDLHPSISLAELVQALKQGSSKWLKENPNFPMFEGWGKEYFAFSVSKSAAPVIINYIIGQEQHHSRSMCNFEEEIKAICMEYGVEWHSGALT